MKTRLLILGAAMLLLSGYTPADIEKAQRAAHLYATEFEKCLVAEIKRLVTTNISSQDFALLIKGSCLKEQNDFLVPLVDYIVMKNNAPASDTSAVLAVANSTVARYQDAAVKSFIEMRASR